ncbi:hypothetical protein GCM10023194_31230 [Planotetraspora phitsanulokensis]|uniref:Uncharacterized protein n=1 Tax=Planotetraspora phitsanulokensis TaxID=575192 RepID=A0A8J3TZY0_9ACTN|nr:hypothetical protein [Planotetraspora phitsanulokensis]GII35739.1 hypothetical protein Pph01_07420 [Planotetraspora phitsanulokensis]
MRLVHLLTVSAAAVVALAGTAEPGMAQAKHGDTTHSRHIQVHRDRPDVRVPVVVKKSGEAVIDLNAAAPGTDWAVKGRESAVVSISVDNRYATDLVVSGGETLHRQLALGRLTAGVHMLRLRFADERSAVASRSVVLDALRVTTYAPGSPEYLVLRYAPVVYGRNLSALGSPYQNATTDTPLIAWHESAPAATPGHTRLTYSVVWSNEDGGTNTPALMARWGRTTDIEWIYDVEVDEHGSRVPGSDTYQAANHQTLHFSGRYEGDHALLETCTSNNNMCDTVDDPMRFFLSPLQTRPADQARENLMDTNSWTYEIMAKEMLREGKIEAPSDATPVTPDVSDQRNYLYAVVKKSTESANTGSSWVGLSLGVRLVNGDTVYTSHHVDPTWSIQRDDPAATTVELPAGTTADDIAEVSVHRVVVGTDSGAALHVTGIKRGFFLGQDYRPQQSFLTWNGDVRLDGATTSAVIWRR